jgi:alanyl-tRNA synthetase
MTVRELRQKYLEFFQKHDHRVHPSGSLIPYDVTGRLDESLMFNGAGMVQFKPYFRGVAKPPHPRLASAQKCVRTGDIESVGDDTHLTFFEMMGNFSFGDYFKREAIGMSWEFLTGKEWLGLDPARLSFTVFTDDDEAHAIWSAILRDAGQDPEVRLYRLGEDTNYWPAGSYSSGPPGPCGPNTEMFYWAAREPPPGRPYSLEDWRRDEAAGRWVEIWNDVFIQYEWQGRPADPGRPSAGWIKAGMPELPFRSVDTGMGLERTAAALAGTSNVYDTDVFKPVLRRIESLSGAKQGEAATRAKRIIADHIRTACFCIADGILPSNTGRGYVLRRLIRRAVLKGQRVLGFERPFFRQMYDGVLEAMGDAYPELDERRDVIRQTLESEETLFRRTLELGMRMLEELIAGVPRGAAYLPGRQAFMLYDTYGFPLEVTQELCRESGLEVDTEGFEAALREAQERSRGAQAIGAAFGGVEVRFRFAPPERSADPRLATPTLFAGYEATRVQTRVCGVVPEVQEEGTPTGRIALALDASPFYVEAGGQVSDTGWIRGEGFEGRVVDLARQDGVIVHVVEPTRWEHPVTLTAGPASRLQEELQNLLFDRPAEAEVDAARRRSIVRNHTATHLLHAALRLVLGPGATQAGSLVAPDHLRFDFTHGAAVSPDELATIERQVNAWAMGDEAVVTYPDIPLSEAKALGAMALFGEKYGEMVRMVQIGDFSRELCGGTHCTATGEIGPFKIVSEGSAASGVRRIEALTGEGALEWIEARLATLRQAAGMLKTNPKDLVPALERALEQLRDERRKRERLAQQGAGAALVATHPVGALELAIQRMEGGEPKDAQLAADRLTDGMPQRVALVALLSEGKLTFVAKCGAGALGAGARAGDLIREVARLTGGGGGGRADFATAGGKQPERLDEALSRAPELLRAMIGA